jgi:DNA-binding MarR family transcriptional regulator
MAESSRYDKKVTEQDVLKVFDRADAPFLTAAELADELPITRSAVNYRLNKMREKGLVEKKATGANAVGWWATVAPRLSDDARERADAADQDSAVSLDDLESEFDAGDA